MTQARVAIITGAGRAFCAGRDLKERAVDNAAGVQARAADSMGADSLAFFDHTWKPMIAAINGYAMAGGWAIAQMCDLRIAAEDAMMGITEARGACCRRSPPRSPNSFPWPPPWNW